MKDYDEFDGYPSHVNPIAVAAWERLEHGPVLLEFGVDLGQPDVPALKSNIRTGFLARRAAEKGCRVRSRTVREGGVKVGIALRLEEVE